MAKKKWTLEDVGAHLDKTEEYDDINKATQSCFRSSVDGYRLMSPVDLRRMFIYERK